MKLLVATSNAGKAREIFGALQQIPVQLVSLSSLNLGQVEERGATLAENAAQKALHYARLSGQITLAEDSALEVDLLGGRPGIHSSRYAPSDRERIERLLAELAASRAAARSWPRFYCFLSSARFVCSICVASDRILFATEASCEGAILDCPVAGGGFGYDPVFFSSEAAAPLSRLSVEEKNRISHRGKALRQVRQWLGRLQIADCGLRI